MTSYIIRRLLLLIPTMFLVTAIVFFTIRLIPGDVIDLMIMEHQEVGEAVDKEALRRALGLDEPVHVQYAKWMWNILQGDLGTSLWTGREITAELIHRFPISFELGLMGILIGLIIALPIGVYSAIRQDTWGDYLGRSFAIACIAIPYFWLGTMAIVYPSIWWNWTPAIGYIPFKEDPLGNLAQFIIPGIIQGMFFAGTTMRITRTMMLEVLRQDYIRTAWSKGLKERIVIMRHAMKNALIPVITVVGLQMPILIGGSVILETIFSLPGIGRLVLETLNTRDYTTLSGINLLMASFVLILNLVVDLAYGYLDPRIRYR